MAWLTSAFTYITGSIVLSVIVAVFTLIGVGTTTYLCLRKGKR